MRDPRSQLLEQTSLQAVWCRNLGSPLYGVLLEGVAEDVQRDGPCWRVLESHADTTIATALPLRFMGAVHKLVLAGQAPALAAYYPSAGGHEPATAAWPAFRDTVEAHIDHLRQSTSDGVQTNEVGRAAALIGGFHEVARSTGHPLHLMEVGASGGLNLRWDRFRYATDAGATWGPPDSPVVLRGAWTTPPPLDVAARVVGRTGCDVNPIDVTTEAGRRTLEAYAWPDQTERFALLRAAFTVAARVPATVDREGVASWLARQLSTPLPGTTRVVYHSIVMQYVPDAERDAAITTIAEAGARATRDAPLAWLRMEPGGAQAEVRLTQWPGGAERLIATTGYHGRGVEWLAASRE